MKTYIISGLLCTLTILFSLCCSQSGKRDKVSPVAPPLSDIITVPVSTTRPIINVYIENSGSMNGYVNGVTEFDQTIYNYLVDIKNSDLTNNLNLFHINSKIYPQDNNIEKYIASLNPSSFIGDKGTTDVANILKLILNKTDNQTVSVFISDCIFSPGKYKNADEYLINQQIKIKNDVIEHLRKFPQTAFTTYRCLAKFKGSYFDKNDSRIAIEDTRPFFIWLIGNQEYIASILNKIPDNKFIGHGVQNKLSFAKGKEVEYAIQPNSGFFKLDKKNPKTNIQNLRIDNKTKKAYFNVQVQLNDFLLPTNYLLNADNYKINDNNFSLRISVAPKNPFGYTQLLKFSTNHPKQTMISVELKRKIPEWVELINDNQGIEINKETMDKTYGIKYLIQGIHDAYTFDNDSYTKIQININY